MKSKVWCFVCGVLLCGQVAWAADRVRFQWEGEYVAEPGPADSSVQAVGRYVYTTGGDSFDVIDVIDPKNPVRVGRCDNGGADSLIVVDGNRAYLCGQAFSVIDITEAVNPIRLSVSPSIVGTRGIALLDDSSIVVLSDVGLTVYDISDPANPIQMGQSATTFPSVGVAVEGHNVYVVRWGGLDVFDVADHQDPKQLGTFSVPPDVYVWCVGVAVSQGYAYVAAHPGLGGKCWGVMWVIDVNEPSCPTLVATFNKDGCAMDVHIRGDHCYVGGHGDGIVFDITEPGHLRKAGSWFCGSHCTGIAVSDDQGYAIMLSMDSDWHVFSITELPAITRNVIQNGKLNLQWNEPARGMKLQRATSLENPDWQSLEGSESMTSVELQLWGGPEYFRLMKSE